MGNNERIKIVFTVGVYDLLHIGHIKLFQHIKEMGQVYLIVAVQDSDFVRKYKPEANLVYNSEDRLYMVRAIRFVDEVITYKSVDSIVREVDFDVLATGPDQNHEGFQDAIRWCLEHGKEHIVIQRTEGISSFILKESMKKI